VKQWGVYADYGYTPNPDLKGFNNDYPFPPELEVTSQYLVRRDQRLRRQIGGLAKSAESAGFPAWCDSARDFLARHPDGWEVPAVTGVKSATEDWKALSDGSVLLTGAVKKPEAKKAAQEERDLTLRPAPGRLAALRLELLPDEAHNGSTLRGGRDSTTVKLTATLKTKAGRSVTLAFHRADADEAEPRYAMGQSVIGVLGGWKTSPRHAHSRQQAAWLLEPVTVGDGDELTVKLFGDALGRVCVSASPFATLDPLRADLGERLGGALAVPPASRLTEQAVLLATTHLLSTAHDPAAFARFKSLERDLLECRGGRTWTLVTAAWEPKPTRVLPRGNWQDETGELVQPAVPHFLPQPASPSGRRLTRTDLARWVVAKDNPLTARAAVNRFWKQFFGTGLSANVDDLGAQGEPPSHPELLDWLAVEFRDTWDVKRLVKLIVMSNTYRQDSRLRTELKEIDPANRLLAAQSPRRLEAEFVRDTALFVAGLLDPEVGGPSTRPYQPAGYYASIQFPDRDYVAHTDERQYRRGVYTWWQRTFLHPMLANFDAPSREDCTANRVVSNTPQQALTLLNDPSFVEAARVFAARVLSSGEPTDAHRLDWAFQRVLARPASSLERESLLKFLADQADYYRAHPDEGRKLLHVGLATVPPGSDEARLAAWTACCRALLNLHETITRY
jgi:hypothetical protein